MAKNRGKRRAGTGGNPAGVPPVQELSPEYLKERERLLRQMQMEDDMEDGVVWWEPEAEEDRKQDGSSGPATEAYSHAQGTRNYREFMKKHDKVEATRAMIEEGLGREVSASDLDDELYDPGVRADSFEKEAVQDHAAEFARRLDEPVLDTNGDGRVDDGDEPFLTPGMRRMARYV